MVSIQLMQKRLNECGLIWIPYNKLVEQETYEKAKKIRSINKRIWEIGVGKGKIMVMDKKRFIERFGCTGVIEEIPEKVLAKIRIRPVYGKRCEVYAEFGNLRMSKILEQQEKEKYYESLIEGYKLKKIFNPEQTMKEVENLLSEKYGQAIKEINTNKIALFLYKELFKKAKRGEENEGLQSK